MSKNTACPCGQCTMQLVSERDAVLRERAAFIKGACWRFDKLLSKIDVPESAQLKNHEYQKAALSKYPLLRVTRPRVVAWSNSFVKFERNTFWWALSNDADTKWNELDGSWHATPERVRILADLLAKPTEEVEDDA